MRRLRFLDAVRGDLASIYTCIERQSGNSDMAERFVAQLLLQCEKLAGWPGVFGRARPELRHDLRSHTYKGYIIFFRYIDDDFEVVHILEGHRDIEAIFAVERD